MTKLKQLTPLLLKSRRSTQQYCSHRFLSKMSDNEENNSRSQEESKGKKAARPMHIPDDSPLRIDDIEEPTNCCMSGCPNCVWIEYAEKLSAALKGSQSDIQKIILDKVQDPNMRAFLSMELRVRKIIE